MAGIATQQPSAGDLSVASGDGMGSEMYSHRTDIRAPPMNPNFSFPRLPQAREQSPSSDHPRRARIRPTNLAILAEPRHAIEKPSLSPQAHAESSHESSPTRSRPMSARGGHRREGSQYIGGDGKSGTGLRSTSPTKGVTAVGPPPSSASAAGRRRGHAHRRSGAMSTNDFSAFLNGSVSNAPPLPGSAPATPSGHSHIIPPVPHLERHHSQPHMSTRAKIEEANAAGEKEDREMANTPSTAGSRPRVVGFSDKVVIIPRPLSTISQADTESTISTIRPSHSVNGSISSVLDQRPPTPVSTTHPIDSSDDSRPTTSDTASQPEFFGPAEDVDMTASPERPNSGSGNSFLKRRRSPPPPMPRKENLTPSASDEMMGVESSDPFGVASNSSPDTSPNASEARSERKKKSLRSILSRRSRKQSKDDYPLSSSPPAASEPVDPNIPDGMMSLDDVNFDQDTSTVIHSAGYEEAKPAPYQPSPSPMKQSFDQNDTAILDLDAAYNSVPAENSPSHLANFMRGGVGLRQHRRTESAPSLSPVQRAGFAPGKASPKMADVFEEEEEEDSSQRSQRPKARSFHQPKTRRDLQGLGVQIVDTEPSDSAQPRRKSRSPSSKTTNSDKAPSVSDEAVSPTSDVPPVPDLPIDVSSLEPRFSVVTKSSDEETTTPTGPRSPQHIQNPAVDPPVLPQPTAPKPHPLDFAPPPSLNPHAHHDSSDFSTSSAAPSPNLTTISFDAPRLNTAASSITDRTNWSISQVPTVASNTPACGHDSAASEGVPSLTSSESTALSGHPSHPSISTSASAAASPVIPRGQGAFFGTGSSYHAHTVSGMSRPRTQGVFSDSTARPSSVGAERAFSLAGLGSLSSRPSMPRQWGSGSRPNTSNGSKRSSLASLSRLMSRGGESERSKLSISWGAQDEHSDGTIMGAKEGKDKSGKRRLSRMLKFWKGSKDKDRHLEPLPSAEPMEGVET